MGLDPPAAPEVTAGLDVLGLGCVAVDDLLFVAAYPPADAKVQVRRRERQCGGLTGTALVAAARLGARCAYAGVLGDDEDSRFVRETFRREGMRVDLIAPRAGARPIRSTIIVDEGRKTRTILYDLAGSVGADPEWPPEDVIRSARVLLVDHYGVEGIIRAARLAQPAGIAVVADLERSDRPRFAELLGLVDHLIISRGFAEKLTGEAGPAAAIGRLWSEARQVVVITCGADGCWFRGAGDSSRRHQPAFPVPVVDTTGCGDVFHGAYASALARGLGLADRIRFASAAAALKATRPGGQAGIPTRAATEAFLQEQRSGEAKPDPGAADVSLPARPRPDAG
jgi:sugar/nucleoside kinase (ribokinase family)